MLQYYKFGLGVNKYKYIQFGKTESRNSQNILNGICFTANPIYTLCKAAKLFASAFRYPFLWIFYCGNAPLDANKLGPAGSEHEVQNINNSMWPRHSHSGSSIREFWKSGENNVGRGERRKENTAKKILRSKNVLAALYFRCFPRLLFFFFLRTTTWTKENAISLSLLLLWFLRATQKLPNKTSLRGLGKILCSFLLPLR